VQKEVNTLRSGVSGIIYKCHMINPALVISVYKKRNNQQKSTNNQQKYTPHHELTIPIADIGLW